jgi:25S rRNA (uracil2634-N3)-methyltransferase
MAPRDNKGQAKIKAKGTHSHGRGVVKSKKLARNKVKKQTPVATDTIFPSGTAVDKSGAGLGDGTLRVLLLGEGNFSFAAALALEWGDAASLTATTLASESVTMALGGDVEDNLETVKAFGAAVCFKVDATALNASSSELVLQRGGKKGYERIVFNFPNAEASTASHHMAVEANQALLRGVFKSVMSNRLLKSSVGELHLTLRQADAADWKLVDLARLAGLRLRSSAPFDAARYQGYEPASPAKDAVTFVLVEPPPKIDAEQQKAKAIAALAKAHPELRIGPTGQTYKEAWKQRHRKAKR